MTMAQISRTSPGSTASTGRMKLTVEPPNKEFTMNLQEIHSVYKAEDVLIEQYDGTMEKYGVWTASLKRTEFFQTYLEAVDYAIRNCSATSAIVLSAHRAMMAEMQG